MTQLAENKEPHPVLIDSIFQKMARRDPIGTRRRPNGIVRHLQIRSHTFPDNQFKCPGILRMDARSPAPQHPRTDNQVSKASEWRTPPQHSLADHLSRVAEWHTSPRHSTELIRVLRVLHPDRIWFMRGKGAVDFRCPKLSPRQSNEAPILAGCHRLRQLPGGLSRRLVTWCHRAGCRRVLVRRCGYGSEKRTARFFKRIFRFCIGLFHLGLLVSSSFVLRSASSPAIHPFLSSDRGGLAPRSLDQIVSYCVQRPSLSCGRKGQAEIRIKD
jgi:hypothetical protein